MLITEKDLYKYIFFPSSLSRPRKVYIDNNVKKFSAQIELLTGLKADLESSIPAELTEKIISKIQSKQENSETILEKREVEKNGYDQLILAAATKNEIPELVTQTYFNHNKTFIVKIVSNKKTSKIYFFAPGDKELCNPLLKFYPSLKTYEINENVPLEIERVDNVEKIGIINQFDINL